MVARRDGSSGETLIEVLIALAIMGISVTALLSGMATASKAAALHRDHADTSTYLLQAADLVKSAAYDSSCTANPYESLLTAVTPASWTSRGGSAPKTSVAYWNPLTNKFDGTCPAAADNRGFVRVELVTLTISAPGGKFTDSLSVAKRILT